MWPSSECKIIFNLEKLETGAEFWKTKTARNKTIVVFQPISPSNLIYDCLCVVIFFSCLMYIKLWLKKIIRNFTRDSRVCVCCVCWEKTLINMCVRFNLGSPR
jgi:hypothetical protein